MSKNKSTVQKKAQQERKRLRESRLTPRQRALIKSINKTIQRMHDEKNRPAREAKAEAKKARRAIRAKQGIKKTNRNRRILIRLSGAQNHRCCYCGVDTWHPNIDIGTSTDNHPPKTRATLEHVVPRSQGGTYGVYNLVMACNECNAARGDRTIESFLKSIHAEPPKQPTKVIQKDQPVSRNRRLKMEKKSRNLFRLLVVAAHIMPDNYNHIMENPTPDTHKSVFGGGSMKPKTARAAFLTNIRHRVRENQMVA